MARFTRETREAVRLAISEAARAALPPNARPGHPSRFGFVQAAASTGREVRRPTLQYYDDMPPGKPQILRELNG